MRHAVIALLSLAVSLAHANRAAADWPQWRGPNFNGSTASSPLPTYWTKSDNIAWATDMPGPSAATPAVVGGRIYVTAFDESSMAVSALCVDRHTGAVLWTHDVGQGRTGPRAGFENTRGECSPVSDGTVACFLFGHGTLVAFDPDGTKRWERDLVGEFGSFENQWGYASSPLLLDGTVYVQVLRSGESFLLAVDAKSGETRWRHVRGDASRSESEQAYTSPIPFDNGGRTEILVLGADCLTSHDPKTGEEHWRWSDLNPNDRGNFRAITNPVAGPDGFVYVTSPQGNPLHALQVAGDTVAYKWTLRRGTPDVCTPLYHDGRLYVLDGKRRRRMTCLEPTTGDVVWEAEIDSPTYVRSSPTAADGKIYVMDAEGFVNVLATGDEFRVLGQNDLEAYPSRASIAIDDGQLIIRAADRLYCVGIKAAASSIDTAAAAPAPADRPGNPPAADRDVQRRWPSFRGPGARGIDGADAHPLPSEWDVPSGRNVAWKTPVPGLAHSSPVIWGDRLFVTTAVRSEGEAELKVGLYGSIAPVDDNAVHSMEVHCLDARTGKPLWKRVAFEGRPAVKRHPKGSHAASSPATDGKHVVAFFASEGLYCYDIDGALKWKRDLGVLDSGFYMVPDAQWGFASSPVIHGEVVLIQCDVQENSFVAALSLEDGRDVWRTPRADVPTWGSPTVHVGENRSQVIVNGWKHIGSYDLRTGAEVWKLEGGGDIPVPTPIVAHDLIFITNAHGRMAPIYAIKTSARGTIVPDVSDDIVWWQPRRGNYMQTPLVYGDELWTCTDSGVIACLDARTGEEHFRERLGSGQSGFTASIVAGDGKVFATSEDGEVHAVKAAKAFEVLSVNDLGATCMATPAIAAGTIYFRTRHHVVAVSATPNEAP